MPMLNDSTIGVLWFDEANWRQMREMHPGEFRIPYQTWLSRMTESLHTLEHKGFKVARVTVAAQDYLQWCSAHARRADDTAWRCYTADLFGADPGAR